jgi:hypothetical protein
VKLWVVRAPIPLKVCLGSKAHIAYSAAKSTWARLIARARLVLQPLVPRSRVHLSSTFPSFLSFHLPRRPSFRPRRWFAVSVVNFNTYPDIIRRIRLVGRHGFDYYPEEREEGLK